MITAKERVESLRVAPDLAGHDAEVLGRAPRRRGANRHRLVTRAPLRLRRASTTSDGAAMALVLTTCQVIDVVRDSARR